MLTCFVDLDGVLVDFVGGAMDCHGKSIPRSEVRWDLPAQFGLSPEAFWAPMGDLFWRSLDWTEEGKSLLAGLERIFQPENIAILTSPCLTPGGVEGKVQWVRQHLPGYSRRFFVGGDKRLLAGITKILIDDHEKNVDDFVTAIGNGVLVPRPWNRRRAETDGEGRFRAADVLAEIEGEADRVYAWCAFGKARPKGTP